jgi:hypothetical protein
MELRPTKNTVEIGNTAALEARDSVEERLNTLLAANAGIARERSLYRSGRERLEAETMLHPIPLEKAFSYFGFMLGSMPAAAMVLGIVFEGRLHFNDIWFPALILFAGLMTGVVGYFSGKKVARTVRSLDRFSISNRILLLPLIGIAWGVVSGAAGGIFLFVVGAIFGGFIGGALGSVAVPLFAGLTALMKCGDVIDRKYFLPISFGITLTICSLILGL